MCFTKLASTLLFTACLVLLASNANAQTVRYVDADATGANDGSNWCDAFRNVQDALAAAVSGDTIRVAEGSYMPDGGYTPVGGSHIAGTGDRAATFQMLSGVELQGGYAGCGEPNPDARYPDTKRTILSGDLAGNDGPGPFDNTSDNAFHVVTGSGTDATAVLDGFVVTAARADTVPGHYEGGGMRNVDGSPTVLRCTFIRNAAFDGGGAYNVNSNARFVSCAFIGNRLGLDGGFSNHGGGIRNDGGAPTISNCVFSGNVVTAGVSARGGGISNYGSDVTVNNCTFSGNSVLHTGGGMYNDNGGNVTVRNCIFWGNAAEAIAGPTVPGVTYSDVQGGFPGTGNINADPLFVDADGPDHTPGTEDDNLRLGAASPCIDAGDTATLPVGLFVDLAGAGRVVDDPSTNDTGVPAALIQVVVDIGAYEYSDADLDRDGDVDLSDFAIFQPQIGGPE